MDLITPCSCISLWELQADPPLKKAIRIPNNWNYYNYMFLQDIYKRTFSWGKVKNGRTFLKSPKLLEYFPRGEFPVSMSMRIVETGVPLFLPGFPSRGF